MIKGNKNLRNLSAFFGMVLLTLTAGLIPLAPAHAESLYIGDEDNTIKRFDADTGAFIDTFVSGLDGPRGLLIDGNGNLLVSNQKIASKTSGEILRYNGQTGTFLNALIPSKSRFSPFAPRGIILDTKLYVSDLRNGDLAKGRVRTFSVDGNFLGDLNLHKAIKNDLYPQGIVFGPDGKLYVSVRNIDAGQLGGHVIRFMPDGTFDKVFITDKGGFGKLNGPGGLVFGPDKNLYITSFQANSRDTDSIRVYSGDGLFLRKIDLETPISTRLPNLRERAQSIIFGPKGCLFVPINDTGEVRRYNVDVSGAGTCDVTPTQPYDSFIQAGGLVRPWYMTFEKTDPKTLAYNGGGGGSGTGPNLQICICADNTRIDICAPVNCDSGIDQDAICGPLCTPHGGERATGCLFADPSCAVP